MDAFKIHWMYFALMGLEPIDIAHHVFSANRINLSTKRVLNNDFCVD
jgi:LPS sulfotransferase NodH